MRRATYRVQMRTGFGFDDAAGVSSYLAALGISDLYCSPLLQATPGSTHGYDVVDHSRVSSDLGGSAGFARMVEQLRSRSMGLTVDIVPNHMAIDGRGNRWWWDVLENGPSSLYASYFDIDWPGDDSRHEPSVLVPVLGDRYGRILESGQVRLRREGGSFVLVYFDHELPVSPRTIDVLLQRAADSCSSVELADLGQRFGGLPSATVTDPAAVRIRHDQKEELRDRLGAHLQSDRRLAAAVDAEVERVNADADEMDRLLVRQNYRLAYWRTAREELDYRRFFNIETLVGLRVEDDQVFADTHDTISSLVREGAVTGLRVDHVDGLLDPEGYLQRLRRLTPSDYVAVEKILERDEALPAEWPVDGTTGYEFIARVANAFIDPSGEEPLTRTYEAVTGEPGDFDSVVRAAKDQILRDELAPELHRLARLLHSICEDHRSQRDRTASEVRKALVALLIAFPVYRTYFHPDRPRRDPDMAQVHGAVAAAKAQAEGVDADLLDFIGELLMLEWPGAAETSFALRFPQVSAPVMAKGVEDTAFYRYNRMVSLNEVGGDPGAFGRPLTDFHAATLAAAERHPRSMLALATHDTKRSPDVRARIGLLSELPDAWDSAVNRWMEMTEAHVGDAGPDRNTRYLLFQTLVGAWPIAADRLVGYMDKAAKEAKVHTAWAGGNPDFDQALRRFVEATVSDPSLRADLEQFMAVNRVVELGRATSLAMTALHLTCPGVPDIYQGTETWDDSLVDPDNRRPVDFGQLASLLGSVGDRPADSLALDPRSAAAGWAKCWLTFQLLASRARKSDAYDSGCYRPLTVSGPRSGHLIAFDRGGVVVLAARHLVGLEGGWSGTTVELPGGDWRTVVGAGGSRTGGTRPVAELMGHGPVAVLEG